MALFSKAIKDSLIASGMAISSCLYPVNADDKGFDLTGGIGTATFSDIQVTGSILTVDFDHWFSGEAGFGYDFGKSFRTDVTYISTTSKVVAGNEAVLGSVMGPAYLDFPIENTNMTPFLGLGIGTTHVDATNLCTSGGNDSCTDDVQLGD